MIDHEEIKLLDKKDIYNLNLFEGDSIVLDKL